MHSSAGFPTPKEQRGRDRVYVDMDGVLADFVESYVRLATTDMKYPQATYGFFERLNPIPGAIDAYFELANKYNVWILTRPSLLNPLSYTEKRAWVEHHLGLEEVHRLIMTPDKTLNHGQLLIDDCVQTGVDVPSWQHIHFGSDEFPDWNAVLTALL